VLYVRSVFSTRWYHVTSVDGRWLQSTRTTLMFKLKKNNNELVATDSYSEGM
jgi:hypothetical protein